MKIVGCDLHAKQQTIAMMDTEIFAVIGVPLIVLTPAKQPVERLLGTGCIELCPLRASVRMILRLFPHELQECVS